MGAARKERPRPPSLHHRLPEVKMKQRAVVLEGASQSDAALVANVIVPVRSAACVGLGAKVSAKLRRGLRVKPEQREGRATRAQGS